MTLKTGRERRVSWFSPQKREDFSPHVRTGGWRRDFTSSIFRQVTYTVTLGKWLSLSEAQSPLLQKESGGLNLPLGPRGRSLPCATSWGSFCQPDSIPGLLHENLW